MHSPPSKGWAKAKNASGLEIVTSPHFNGWMDKSCLSLAFKWGDVTISKPEAFLAIKQTKSS